MQVLFDLSPDGGYYIFWLLEGLVWTIALAIVGWALAFAIGVLVGIGRTVENPYGSAAARIYVEIFRNVPLIVQMFIWYFVMPELLPAALGTAIKHMPPPWGSVVPAVLALACYTGARVAEQIRAGIEALARGQREAAAALGLRPHQAYRLVILPQALRIVVPSLTSEVMGIFKNTSVALTIGVLELTAQARHISESTFQTFAAFGAATLLYLLLALLTYGAMAAIERWAEIPGLGATTKRASP